MTKRWGPNCTSDLGKSKRQAAKKARADVKRFIKEQEPLGPEFEAPLFDNLWDLYARN